jgi:hypothetical protein
MWDGAVGAVERTDGTGQCTTTVGETALDCRLSAPAAVGAHALTLQNDQTSAVIASATITLAPH